MCDNNASCFFYLFFSAGVGGVAEVKALTQGLSCRQPCARILHQELLHEVLRTGADARPGLPTEVGFVLQDLHVTVD